jgi:hypothetical protein
MKKEYKINYKTTSYTKKDIRQYLKNIHTYYKEECVEKEDWKVCDALYKDIHILYNSFLLQGLK